MLISVLVVALAAASDIAPPPKGEWVVDQTGAVRPETLRALNDIASSLDADGLGQLGVLVVDSVEGAVPRTFAMNVFNHWGVGRRDTNDGTLLMVALGDRKAEIVLGRGSALSPSQTDEVMARALVPNMKQGALDTALLETARALAELHRFVDVDEALQAYVRGAEFHMSGAACDLADALTEDQQRAFSCDAGPCAVLVIRSAHRAPTLAAMLDAFGAQLGLTTVVGLDVGARVAGIRFEPRPVDDWQARVVLEAGERLAQAPDPNAGLHDALAFVATIKRDGYPPRSWADVVRETASALLCPGLCGLVVAPVVIVFWLLRWNRRRVRSCVRCRQPRRLLTEAEEDAHLNARQQAEETAKSVEYDVWWCGTCSDAMVLSWAGLSTSVKHCPRCNAKTNITTESEITKPELHTAGLKRLEERCSHCTYVHAWDVTTLSISDSSSSSSDSSFGGGDSSGSGSSGSW